MKVINVILSFISVFQVYLFATWIYCFNTAETVAERYEMYSRFTFFNPFMASLLIFILTIISMVLIVKYAEKLNKFVWVIGLTLNVLNICWVIIGNM